ncbi:MAG: ATP-binding protein, partial [Moorea sp. SIO4G2]|nr:ATP-binding protein [Moorena sp. SIO4G2]
MSKELSLCSTNARRPKDSGNDWIWKRRNLLIIGPTGIGKSYLACALGNKACRDDLSAAYHRAPRLFAALALA